jgi:amino-acid N-acetyltransferase
VLTETSSGHCVEVRAAEAVDLPEVLAMLKRAELPTEGVADSFQHFIVARSEGKLVGAVGLELYSGSALLRSAAVEPDWRGSGVGRVLVERALDLARQRGVEDIYLLTTTAEHYFPRFGFACISRDSVRPEVQSSTEFQSACPASATAMRKTLTSERTPA